MALSLNCTLSSVFFTRKHAHAPPKTDMKNNRLKMCHLLRMVIFHCQAIAMLVFWRVFLAQIILKHSTLPSSRTHTIRFNPYCLQQQQQHRHHEDDKDKANERSNQPQVKRSPFIPVSSFLVMDIHTFPNQMHSLKLK